jgi:prevent-host-death family protein
MASVTAFEAKNRLGQLLARASAGEEITITRHGEPVAKLVPVRERGAQAGVAAVRALASLRRQLARRKVRVSRNEAKTWIQSGRR